MTAVSLSERSWRSIAKSLIISGAVSCAILFVLQVVLLVYYSETRPDVPRPEVGFTVGLTWTHPVRYGTKQEERRSQWLFELFFPGFALIAAGEMVKIYKFDDYSGIRTRPNPPWNHRWGP